MAYEGVTYEHILQRMMDRVKMNNPNLDTREGSIIFNALAPAALELAIMYTELDNVLAESFVGTASREYLLTACSQMGMDVSIFSASYGEHKGVFNVEVPIGSRWSYELYNYVVTEYIGVDENNNHEYKMYCETVGAEPNTATGDLTAISHVVDKLTYAKVTECLVEGEDETPNEDIRSTYYEYVRNSAVDGNIAQYERWCQEYDGIGNCKVFPLWDGDNTVKVSILSASNGVASAELVNEFQEYLDPNSEGMGNGVAPIGSFVTVSTAEDYPIDFSVIVTKKQGYSDELVRQSVENAIKKYFSEIAYKTTVVSYMGVGAAILNADGVYSLDFLELDQTKQDVDIGDEKIPTILRLEVELK